MEKIINNERMMLRVCDLYYNRDVSQSEIARLMDLSRPTVAKLLKTARQRRIVEITIRDPQQRPYSELERKLEKTFKLQEVIVADTVEPENQKEVLGKAAARYLESILKDNLVIGVGSGTTLRYAAPDSSRQFHNLTFVPLLGGNGNLDVALNANYVVDVFSKAFGGTGMHLYVPAILTHIQTKKTLMKEDSVRKVMNFYNELDVAVVGIGTADSRSSAIQSGYYPESTRQQIEADEICGDICMHMFDLEGNIDRYDYNNHVFGIKPSRLKKLPYSIGVASGAYKARAILGAIRGGYINVLVTDAECAKELYALQSAETL